MMGGVLAVSMAAGLHTKIQGWLEASGFEDITVTDKENDALNTVICNKDPRLVIIDSRFYQDGKVDRFRGHSKSAGSANC